MFNIGIFEKPIRYVWNNDLNIWEVKNPFEDFYFPYINVLATDMSKSLEITKTYGEKIGK